MYFVTAKVTTSKESYMAVSAKPQVSRALTEVRQMLRRSMSRGASVTSYTHNTQTMLQEYVDSYTLTL